jgi:hypothetical protein
MTDTVVFPTANYTSASGPQTSANVSIADASTVLRFALDRSSGTIWSQSGTFVKAEVDVSLDGGGTWIPQFFFTAQARDLANPKDSAVNSAFVSGALPPGTGRLARVVMTVSNGTMHSTGTLTDI